ncbi:MULTISPECIES: SDR family oxidoreductase [Hydrogenophaga]|uniref:Short-chain dehydrogenase reductase sdr n=1 Tax=Hydrogenophaga intermedia TaxID=65786 RepID=A0A1L1PDU7_HYDIT|nr:MULTISPECIES: SDR family oxidoreductase [Hydrogenophaga]AOS77559.1 short chain dehydrogenase [Hydrogenophaga sp. PBC]TMU75714.1 SDR family oxidoreductase [Hydrogenophaga intermedia]CDN86213.1 Short-chain dehydrogenase reductase sdr [Hydrogenophaga intermedia]
MPSPQTPRTALVTGAGRRLGREIAITLARAGWNVAVHHRHSLDEARQTADDCEAASGRVGSAHTFFADLSDEASVRALLPAVAARFGAVDAVVNSASTFEHDSAGSFDFATMEAHLRANTGAPVLLAQALHAHLAERDARGAVVNLLDQKLWSMNPDFFSYTLSKAALEAANTMLALALAPRVRVVGVAPGLTLTSHLLTDEKFQQLHQQSPLGRSSTPADVAAAVAFALDNGSITGTTLLVDGGQHLMRFERDFSLM